LGLGRVTLGWWCDIHVTRILCYAIMPRAGPSQSQYRSQRSSRRTQVNEDVEDDDDPRGVEQEQLDVNADSNEVKKSDGEAVCPAQVSLFELQENIS